MGVGDALEEGSGFRNEVAFVVEHDCRFTDAGQKESKGNEAEDHRNGNGVTEDARESGRFFEERRDLRRIGRVRKSGFRLWECILRFGGGGLRVPEEIPH